MQEQLSALQKIIDTVIELSVNYSFQVVGAIIVLIIGFLIAHGISNAVLKLCQKKNLDITLSKFMAMFVRLVIISFAVIISLGNFGITIAPFVAALGGLAFGASFALQGPLSNYGAGFAIIMSRPFTVGDTITIAGVSGVVDDVKLANTQLVTEDNVRITIPNKHIVGEVLQNSKKHRIVEAVVGISYASNPEKAIKAIQDILSRHPEVTKEPSPQIGIQDFGDSSINISYRYWVPTLKFIKIQHDINGTIFKTLKDVGVQIPFPQRDVHIVSQPSKVS